MLEKCWLRIFNWYECMLETYFIHDVLSLDIYTHMNVTLTHPGKGAFGKLSSRNVSEWEKKFTALIKYRDANGTCNVPTKNNSLGRWVSNQRKKYRDFLADQGKGQEQDFGWDSELQNRFQRLKDAGFNFHVGKGGNQPYKKSC